LRSDPTIAPSATARAHVGFVDTRGHLANERSARDRRNGQCGQDRRTTPKGVGKYAEAVIPPNLFRGPAPTEI